MSVITDTALQTRIDALQSRSVAQEAFPTLQAELEHAKRIAGQ